MILDIVAMSLIIDVIDAAPPRSKPPSDDRFICNSIKSILGSLGASEIAISLLMEKSGLEYCWKKSIICNISFAISYKLLKSSNIVDSSVT